MSSFSASLVQIQQTMESREENCGSGLICTDHIYVKNHLECILITQAVFAVMYFLCNLLSTCLYTLVNYQFNKPSIHTFLNGL